MDHRQQHGIPLLDLDELSHGQIRIDLDEIARFDSQSQFLDLAVGMSGKLVGAIATAGCVVTHEQGETPRPWSRDEAILRAHLPRLAKLLWRVRGEVMKGRGEIALTLVRGVCETAANLKYLVNFATEEMYEDYVRYSLRRERQLEELIESKVRERGGSELGIEKGLRASLARDLEAAGSEQDPSVDEPTSWARTLYQRAKSVGYGGIYLAAFRMASHTVHGITIPGSSTTRVRVASWRTARASFCLTTWGFGTGSSNRRSSTDPTRGAAQRPGTATNGTEARLKGPAGRCRLGDP